MRINPLKKEEPKKAYACAQSSKTMNINQFTEHIATHGASTAVRTLRLSGTLEQRVQLSSRLTRISQLAPLNSRWFRRMCR